MKEPAKNKAIIDLKFDKALIIIKKYEIKAAYLARLLGIIRGSMNNKLKGHAYDKFSDEQKEIIIAHLKEFEKDLQDIEK